MPLLALDRAFAPVRTYDADSRMRVAGARISRAMVSPYRGEEIPRWGRAQESLDRDREYQLLRDPKELAKGAATFNGVPLLSSHRWLDAADDARELVVGAVGDCRYEHPFLIATVTVWDRDAIDLIESGERRQLSCGYRYRPLMTPGTYDGTRYDGVMTYISGHHCALVPTGRAGADCSLEEDDGQCDEVESRRARRRRAQDAGRRDQGKGEGRCRG